jgi:hypothetical protein
LKDRFGGRVRHRWSLAPALRDETPQRIVKLRETGFVGVGGEPFFHPLHGSRKILGGLQIARIDQDLSDRFMPPVIVYLRSQTARDGIARIQLQGFFHKRFGGRQVLRQQPAGLLDERTKQSGARGRVAGIETLGFA